MLINVLLTDVNECLFPDLHKCSAKDRCVDQLQSFVCESCGESCQDSGTPCSPNPCLHGATCSQSGDNDYRCRCKQGYAGQQCEMTISIKSCVPNPCLNDGQCNLSDSGEVYCQCRNGWIGRYCHVNSKSTCDLKPCLNNGTCVDKNNSYTCICDREELGPNCEILSPCSKNDICQFGGYCLNLNDGTYRCLCLPGHTGQNCQIEIVTSTAKPIPKGNIICI